MHKKDGIPTLKSIASQTGFTVNTVSLALRNSSLVAPDTKKRIRDAARELGYVHNVVAGSLRSGRTHTIAVIFGDIANMLFSIKIAELENALRRKGYQMLILNTNENAEQEYAAVRTAISRQMDGIILCPCQDNRLAMELMDQHGVPYVLIGRRFEGYEDDAVLWEDQRGAYLATSHLAQRGCKKILMLNVTRKISSALERRQGYMEAMAEAGLMPMECEVPLSGGGVGAVLNMLSERGTSFDGIFTFSDLIAFDAASWLMEKGVEIPREVKIVGFDDILSHIRVPFRLTSVSADKARETELAVDMLLKRIEEPEFPHTGKTVRMPVRLTVRRSSQ